MYYHSQIIGIKADKRNTYLLLKTDIQAKNEIIKYNVGNGIFGELRVDDGRRITSSQRKKLYATFGDIADYTGDVPEYIKEWLKFEFCGVTGEEYFSLSNCSVSVARDFISFVINFVIMHGIPLKELALDRTDDISKYIYSCLKHKKCCICGRPYPDSPHHIDTIGMGNDRRKVDDSEYLKLPLCPKHHAEIHNIGNKAFCRKHKVYGIKF